MRRKIFENFLRRVKAKIGEMEKVDTDERNVRNRNEMKDTKLFKYSTRDLNRRIREFPKLSGICVKIIQQAYRYSSLGDWFIDPVPRSLIVN